MAGVLDYKKYLTTLQTVTEVGNTFPSSQTTYTYTVGGSGQQGWTATIQWMTLIIDDYTVDSSGTPDFSNTRVFGYYPGGSANQYSTGTISFPANMYTGPILPASTYHAPITVVNINWVKEGVDYAANIALIQNWEPGVTINDPYLDAAFEPMINTPSTLELIGQGRVIYYDDVTFTVVSDIPEQLPAFATATFFWDDPGGRVRLGSAGFNDKTATLTVNTEDIGFTGGTYPIYAEFPGFRQYGPVRSNTLQQVVASAIPLIVQSESFTPSQEYYFTGESVNYSLTVVQDPNYEAQSEPISNSVSMKLSDSGLNVSLIPDTTFKTGAFFNGSVNGSFTITSAMIDTALIDSDTVRSVTTTTLGPLAYTATIFVNNTHKVITNWDFYRPGRYDAGFTTATFKAASTITKTIIAEEFPLTISVTSTETEPWLGDDVVITVDGRNNRLFQNNISITASNGSTSTTLATFAYSNANNTYSTTTTILSTGTWTLQASFPGDLGTNLDYGNLPSVSNTASIRIYPFGVMVPTPRTFIARDFGPRIGPFLSPASTITSWARSQFTLTNTVTYTMRVIATDGIGGISSYSTTTQWVKNTYNNPIWNRDASLIALSRNSDMLDPLNWFAVVNIPAGYTVYDQVNMSWPGTVGLPRKINGRFAPITIVHDSQSTATSIISLSIENPEIRLVSKNSLTTTISVDPLVYGPNTLWETIRAPATWWVSPMPEPLSGQIIYRNTNTNEIIYNKTVNVQTSTFTINADDFEFQNSGTFGIVAQYQGDDFRTTGTSNIVTADLIRTGNASHSFSFVTISQPGDGRSYVSPTSQNPWIPKSGYYAFNIYRDFGTYQTGEYSPTEVGYNIVKRYSTGTEVQVGDRVEIAYDVLSTGTYSGRVAGQFVLPDFRRVPVPGYVYPTQDIWHLGIKVTYTVRRGGQENNPYEPGIRWEFNQDGLYNVHSNIPWPEGPYAGFIYLRNRLPSAKFYKGPNVPNGFPFEYPGAQSSTFSYVLPLPPYARTSVPAFDIGYDLTITDEHKEYAPPIINIETRLYCITQSLVDNPNYYEINLTTNTLTKTS
jgi:hypothetical protein